MTRKQAIYQAIQVLSASSGNEQTISLLQDIYDEIPLIHWSDKSIRDRIEQFIVDHGRIPTASDFRKKGMPPRTVIKQKYGITLAEWLSINYPKPQEKSEEKSEIITREFIATYHNLKPTSSKDFDRRRPNGVSCWATVARYHGCTNWTSLLDKLSLPSYSRCRDNGYVEIKVTVIHDLLNDDEEPMLYYSPLKLFKTS